jgi:hypothetical protein
LVTLDSSVQPTMPIVSPPSIAPANIVVISFRMIVASLMGTLGGSWLHMEHATDRQ